VIIQIIGYWCLLVAVIGQILVFITAINKPVNHQAHITLALYFMVAVLALR
jgi:hypothetical protein